MKENWPSFTEDEEILRIWDVENIKKLMAKRFYYNTNDWREKELEELWVSQPENTITASFGTNWGYYVGMDEIRGYYVDKHAAEVHAHLERIAAADPTVTVCEENLNIGCCTNRPISTGLIRLAGDGKTARGLWYSIGHQTISEPDGTADARWILEKCAADFIREDGAWKIWHIVFANDICLEVGADYADYPVYPEPGYNPLEVEFGDPTIKMLTHDGTFNWWDNYPAPPAPYYTFDPENSYGPEGHCDPPPEMTSNPFEKYADQKIPRRRKDSV